MRDGIGISPSKQRMGGEHVQLVDGARTHCHGTFPLPAGDALLGDRPYAQESVCGGARHYDLLRPEQGCNSVGTAGWVQFLGSRF